MKKVILIVLVLLLAALPVTFAACSSVSQASLLQIAYICSEEGEELYTYDVYHLEADNTKTKVGTMTMSFKLLDHADVTLDDPTAEDGKRIERNVSGGLLVTTLTMDNDDSILSEVVYRSTRLSPIYSYKKTVIGGTEKIMQVIYGNGKYLHAKRFEGGVLVNDYRHERSGCYDNEQLYAIVRGAQFRNSAFSISYTCVNALAATEDTIKINEKSMVTPLAEAIPLAEGMKCFSFSISTDNDYSGNYYMTIADSITVNGKTPKNVIHTIVEGEYVYALTAIAIS